MFPHPPQGTAPHYSTPHRTASLRFAKLIMDLVTASLKLATLGVAAYGVTVLGRDFRMGMGNLGEGIHRGLRDIGSGSTDGSAGGSLSGGLSKGLAEGISGLSPGLQGGLKYAGEAISPGIQGAGANFGRSWFDFILSTQLKRKKAETEVKLEAKRLEEALATGTLDTASTIEREAMERRLQAIRNLQKQYGF